LLIESLKINPFSFQISFLENLMAKKKPT